MSTVSQIKPTFQFWLLSGFLVIVFFTGGASRIDVQSLILLRPLSVITCAIALLTIKPEHLRSNPLMLIGFAVCFVLALLHLIPMPNNVWSDLSGRADLVVIDRMVSVDNNWRALAIMPYDGWLALSSLATPLAVVILGVQLTKSDRQRLLWVLLGLGSSSGIVGLMQAIGSSDSALYFYKTTNNGSAVGLFANRNHAATLLACMFPMLACFALTDGSSHQVRVRRQWIAVSIAIIIVPLVLVTGSRSGLFAALIAIVGATMLIRKGDARTQIPGNPLKRGTWVIQLAGGLAVLCIGLATYLFSRAEAIERLFSGPAKSDVRGDFWIVSLDLFWKYFPWGSGSGSFVESYQIVEPTKLLNPTYLNRAHNDWIETAVTFGLLGVIFLAAAVVAFSARAIVIWQRKDGERMSIKYARMASICIAIIALTSISDYPLRTPTMMSVIVIFALWFSIDPSQSTRIQRTPVLG